MTKQEAAMVTTYLRLQSAKWALGQALNSAKATGEQVLVEEIDNLLVRVMDKVDTLGECLDFPEAPQSVRDLTAKVGWPYTV